MEVISRKQAKQQGLIHYFTGVPCKHGHLSKRWTSHGQCIDCAHIWKATPEYKALMRKHGKSESRREYDLSVGGKAAHKRAWDKYVAAGKRVVYTNAKLSEDPQFAIQFRLRKRIYRAIKKGYKAGSAVRDLGCSIEEAKGYWESLPTWNPEWSWADWGKLFQMDHIRPLGLFDMTDREQFVQAVHYTNLQPLSIEAHLKKSGAEYSVIMAGRL